MENTEIISLISLLSSIASIILSIFAIWLAFMFFRMSSSLNEKSANAAKQVSTGVEKLEKLFDNLYNYPASETEISEVMEKMRLDGQIIYEGELTPSSPVMFSSPGES